tara:strand:- start:106 stop:495 length:390 start_codon:yes stop_codon:yes gene_type:complete
VRGFNNPLRLDDIPKFLHVHGAKVIRALDEFWFVPYNTRDTTSWVISPRVLFPKAPSIVHVVLEQRLAVSGLNKFTRKLVQRQFSEKKLLTMDPNKLYDLGAKVGMSHEQCSVFAMSWREILFFHQCEN